MQPSNTVTAADNTLHHGIQANDGQIEAAIAIAEGHAASEYNHDRESRGCPLMNHDEWRVRYEQ